MRRHKGAFPCDPRNPICCTYRLLERLSSLIMSDLWSWSKSYENMQKKGLPCPSTDRPFLVVQIFLSWTKCLGAWAEFSALGPTVGSSWLRLSVPFWIFTSAQLNCLWILHQHPKEDVLTVHPFFLGQEHFLSPRPHVGLHNFEKWQVLDCFKIL